MKRLLSLLFLILIFSSCHGAVDHPFPWKPYNQKTIAEAMAAHKPIVIDFWADWCPVCQDLDQELFSVPEVQAKLAQVTALRFDASNQDDAQVQKMLTDYNIEGLPTIVFLDDKGQEIAGSRIIGFATPHDFDQAFALVKIFK